MRCFMLLTGSLEGLSGWILRFIGGFMMIIDNLYLYNLYYLLFMYIYGFSIRIHIIWHIFASVRSEVLLVSELFLR